MCFDLCGGNTALLFLGLIVSHPKNGVKWRDQSELRVQS